MLIDDLADPYRTWQYAERYLGGGTRTYSRYAADLDISPRFHPQHGAPRFLVPTFLVAPQRGDYLDNTIPSALHRIYRHGEGFLLPVHPETLALPGIREQLAGCPAGPPIEVVPSANARTVFVERVGGEPAPPHFLKLHYPKRLSRFTRRLRRQVIALQLWVADELWRVGAPFLPEVAGGVLGHDPVEAWGFLVREPRVRDEPRLPVTVPLFALYGTDVRAPQHPTLLEQLVDHSGEAPEEWIAGRVVAPIISMWVDVLLGTGCAAEPHGQNALLCLTGGPGRTRVVYRDCAIYVDPAIRAAAGLDPRLPPRNVISRDVGKPREQVFSLVYDSFLGHHTLAFLARLARERLGVDPAALHRCAKQAFAARPAAAALLPPTVHYYDDRLHADGDWQLIDTGALPQWR